MNVNDTKEANARLVREVDPPGGLMRSDVSKCGHVRLRPLQVFYAGKPLLECCQCRWLLWGGRRSERPGESNMSRERVQRPR